MDTIILSLPDPDHISGAWWLSMLHLVTGVGPMALFVVSTPVSFSSVTDSII